MSAASIDLVERTSVTYESPSRQHRRQHDGSQLAKYLASRLWAVSMEKEVPAVLSGGYTGWCAARIAKWWRVHVSRRQFAQFRDDAAVRNRGMPFLVGGEWKVQIVRRPIVPPSPSTPAATAADNSALINSSTATEAASPTVATTATVPFLEATLLPAPDPRFGAAATIARAWRSFAARRVYRYCRNLINFRLASEPRALLRTIDPTEAPLFDRAAGVHVRFRLAGSTFPPQICYKLYTHRPVSDIGAFAPRNYADQAQQALPCGPKSTSPQKQRRLASVAGGHDTSRSSRIRGPRSPNEPTTGTGLSAARGLKRQDPAALVSSALLGTIRVGSSWFDTVAAPANGSGVCASGSCGGGAVDEAGWYERHENNGWRPIAIRTVPTAAEDPVLVESAAKAQPFRFSRLVRQQDVLRRRKKRQRDWLRAAYRRGRAAAGGYAAAEVSGAAAAVTSGLVGYGDHLAAPQGSPRHGGGSSGGNGDSDDEISSCDSGSEGHWSCEAEELLLWTRRLDFGRYKDNWSTLATSGPSDPARTVAGGESALRVAAGRATAGAAAATVAGQSAAATPEGEPGEGSWAFSSAVIGLNSL